jgi:hypothetical protein
MLTHEILESQTIVELPAREMLSLYSFNYASVCVRQTNANLQIGAVNINGGQVNNSAVVIFQ